MNFHLIIPVYDMIVAAGKAHGPTVESGYGTECPGQRQEEQPGHLQTL